MAADDKLFKRLFDILVRHTDMRMAEAERATADALGKAWAGLKNAYPQEEDQENPPAEGAETGSQPDAVQAFRDFMQWIEEKRESYGREELQTMLDEAAATLDADQPDFRAAMDANTAATAEADAEQAADEAARNATEEQLLGIAKLLRKAHLMQGESAAALFTSAAETARARYGFSRLQVDEYFLERERAILEIFQNNELRISLGSGPLAEEYTAKIYAASEKCGLMEYMEVTGEDGTLTLQAVFSDEFSEGLRFYFADREAAVAFVEELARKFSADAKAANYSPGVASRPGHASGAGGPAASTRPAHVVVYPLRDFDGTLQSHLGATNYNATLQRMVDSSPDTSLTLEFPVDGIQALDKKTIKIRQYAPVHGWLLAANEITWEASHDKGSTAHLVDTNFAVDKGRIVLNSADRVEMQFAQSGIVELWGPALKTNVELQKAGNLEIHDRFEDCVYSSGRSGGIQFVGENACAIASVFIGNAPSIDDTARRTVAKAFTPDNALDVFDAIARTFICGLGLRMPGKFKEEFSHSFTTAAQVQMRSTEMVMMAYLLRTLQDGVKSAGLSLYHKPKVKTSKLVRSILGNMAPDPLITARQFESWQTFTQKAAESGKGMRALAVPLLPDADDFRRGPDAGHIRQMRYRIFFFVDAAEAYPLLNGDATMREILGRSSAFFDTMREKLDSGDVEACYVDISVQRSATADHASRPQPATLRDLQTLYDTLRRANLDDPFGQARRVPWSVITPRSDTEISFVAQEPDESKIFIETLTSEQKKNWKKVVGHLQSAIPAEDVSLTLLHGRFFERCVFRGTYNKVLLDEFQNNRFEQFTGNNLQFETTLNGCELEEAKLIGIARSSMTLDGLKALGKSALQITYDDAHLVEGRGLTVEDSTVILGGPHRTTLHHGTYKNAQLEFSDTAAVGLLNGDFENCTLIFSNVPVVNLTGSRFRDCTLTLNAGKSPNLRSVSLRQVGAENTLFTIGQLEEELTAEEAMLIGCSLDVSSPMAKFDMTRLLGGGGVKGKIDEISLQNAQLGSPVGGPPGMLEWNVASIAAQVANMNIGTVVFLDRDSLGMPEEAQWRTVTVNGEPSILHGVNHIYAMLGKAKNFEAERPSNATDELARPAKGFAL